MKKPILFALLLYAVGCAPQKTSSSVPEGKGDTRTREVEYLDEETYKLTEYADDKSYGFKENNPIDVGGAHESSGPLNERRFLNALLGPNGEKVFYYRAGSCCHFKTPNGLMNGTGLLDRYRVYYLGGKDTLDIYINMYDKGDLKVPVGFTSKQARSSDRRTAE